VQRKIVKNFHLDVEIVERLERKAARQNRSAAACVRDALAAYLTED
jgi:predicted transcriptional regulator